MHKNKGDIGRSPREGVRCVVYDLTHVHNNLNYPDILLGHISKDRLISRIVRSFFQINDKDTRNEVYRKCIECAYSDIYVTYDFPREMFVAFTKEVVDELCLYMTNPGSDKDYKNNVSDIIRSTTPIVMPADAEYRIYVSGGAMWKPILGVPRYLMTVEWKVRI